jgi:hypothetical protein
MMTFERIYREGYLDGMRHCGFLLEDVSDEELTLGAPLLVDITGGMRLRGYSKEGDSDIEKLHAFYRRLILDVNRQYEEINELRDLLDESNRERLTLLTRLKNCG